jgi:hypothetical protein
VTQWGGSPGTGRSVCVAHHGIVYLAGRPGGRFKRGCREDRYGGILRRRLPSIRRRVHFRQVPEIKLGERAYLCDAGREPTECEPRRGVRLDTPLVLGAGYRKIVEFAHSVLDRGHGVQIRPDGGDAEHGGLFRYGCQVDEPVWARLKPCSGYLARSSFNPVLRLGVIT